MLRWAADTAAVWKGCTKKLSAISFQLDQRPRSRERGFFLEAQNLEESLDADVDRFSLAISFTAVSHGDDFDRVVGVTEANPVVANAKTELRRLNVLQPFYIAFASGEHPGQRMENSQSRGLFDSAEVGLGPVAPHNRLRHMLLV